MTPRIRRLTHQPPNGIFDLLWGVGDGGTWHLLLGTPKLGCEAIARCGLRVDNLSQLSTLGDATGRRTCCHCGDMESNAYDDEDLSGW